MPGLWFSLPVPFFAVEGLGNMGDRPWSNLRMCRGTVDMPTDHAVPLYFNVNCRQPSYASFNYFRSQLRIRAGLGFGTMYNKWGILWLSLCCDLTRVCCSMLGIARLPNFTINERISVEGIDEVLSSSARLPNTDERNDAADGEAGIGGVETICAARTTMAERVGKLGLKCPM